MTKEIADAFGLHPDSLEPVEDDEPLSKNVHCPSCEEWARKYAALEALFDEYRRDVERRTS